MGRKRLTLITFSSSSAIIFIKVIEKQFGCLAKRSFHHATRL
jgi:hypothetical protein